MIKAVTPAPKMKIRTGDTVLVIAGKDKGQRGRVIRVIPEKQMVVLEGLTKDKEGNAVPLNAVWKHRKSRQADQPGDRIRRPSPLHVSKVMLIDPHSDKPTRVGRRLEDGRIVRYAKVSKETVDIK